MTKSSESWERFTHPEILPMHQLIRFAMSDHDGFSEIQEAIRRSADAASFFARPEEGRSSILRSIAETAAKEIDRRNPAEEKSRVGRWP